MNIQTNVGRLKELQNFLKQKGFAVPALTATVENRAAFPYAELKQTVETLYVISTMDWSPEDKFLLAGALGRYAKAANMAAVREGKAPQMHGYLLTAASCAATARHEYQYSAVEGR